MKFIIRRTSISHNEDLPCEEAKLIKATPMFKIDGKDKKEYLFMEINSLKELLALKEKYGDIIIGDSRCKEIPLEIEIYDDYRE